ncbi:mCG142401 [Mus musculus]|nr:mCG142401 [Mus musculus]
MLPLRTSIHSQNSPDQLLSSSRSCSWVRKSNPELLSGKQSWSK